MAYLTTTDQELVDDLVTSVIKSTRLPISQITFQNQDIVGFFDEEQSTVIEPMIRTIREDYWSFNYDQTIVANVYNYAMHPRALAGALRNVVFVDPSNFEIDCPHLDPDQIKTPSYFAFRPGWQGQGFFIQNDMIVLWPQTFTNPSMKLRQKMERRPSKPTLSANCAQITSRSTGAQTITFGAACPFVNGQTVDVISNVGQHSSQADSLLILSGGTTTTITIDPSTPFTAGVVGANVAAGMWVCPSGLTCVPQVPNELYPLYVGRAMIRIAAGLGNQSALNVGTKLATDAIAQLTRVITPRVSGSPKKFVNKNTVGGPYSFPYYR